MTGIAERLAQLPPERRERLLKALGIAPADATVVEGEPVDARARQPATFQQEQLWFVDELAPGQARNHLALMIHFAGPVDRQRLGRALDRVVADQPILSMRLVPDNGRLWLESAPAGPAALRELPVEPGVEASRSPAVRAFVEEPFRLAEELPYRAALIEHDQGVTLLFVAHHIVWDGVSHSLFVRALADAYTSAGNDQPTRLAAAFARHCQEHQQYLGGPDLARDLHFWRERLQGAETLDLPIDRPRPPQVSYEGALISRRLPGDVRAGILALAKRYETSPFTVHLAVMFALLARYTGQDDLVLGTSVDCRPPMLEQALGYYVNMVVLREAVDEDSSFGDLLTQVRDNLREVLRHKHAPFGKIVHAINPARDPGRSPLFQVEFTYERGLAERIEAGDVTITSEVLHDRGARFDLAFIVHDDAELRVDAEFATALLDAASVGNMLEHYERILKAVVADSTLGIADVRLCSEEEEQELERLGTGPAVPVQEESLAHRFLDQAMRNASKVAVEDAGGALTYGELSEAAAALAAQLRSDGIGRGDIVAISHGRSAGFVVGVLAILLTGAAYLPFDPATPLNRAKFMMADAGVRALVTDRSGEETFRSSGFPIFLATARAGETSGAPCAELDIEAIRGSDLAYVIYTSGSTGEPKGTMVEHRSVLNCIDGIWERYGIGSDDKVLHFASLSFDVSVFDIFFPLLNGCTLCIASEEDRQDPDRLVRFIRERGVTFAELPPALLPLLKLDEAPAFHTVSTGGEKFTSRLVAQCQREGRRFFNGYGPTEATIAMILAECSSADSRPPPIGLPIRNHRVHVLSRRGALVPKGVVGELYIGGVGVARGYLNRPDLTEAAFVPDPLGRDPSARFYRTGDLVRWRNDGLLEFVGRVDRQIKINGFRVEPGEIDIAIASFDKVAQSATVLRENGDRKQLVSYVATDGSPLDQRALRAYLSERLPNYMIPSVIVSIPTLPVTLSGKLDERALPQPDWDGARSDERIAPRTELEREVCTHVFEAVLGTDQIGVHDNFFELRGGSLQAMQAVARVREAFQVPITLVEFFKRASVAGIAEHIEEVRSKVDGSPALSRALITGAASRTGAVRLNNSQMRIWNHAARNSDKSIYNMPVFLRLKGELDFPAFRRAFHHVLDQDPALRSRLVSTSDGVVQEFVPAGSVLLDVEEHIAREGGELEIARLAASFAAEPIDLEGPLPIRCKLLRLSEDDHLFLFTAHHIAMDGWSVGLFLSALSFAYEVAAGAAGPDDPRMPEGGPIAAGLEAGLEAELAAPEHLAFWRTELAGGPTDLAWRDPPAAGESVPGIGEVPFSFGREALDAITDVAGASGATPFMVGLSAFARAIAPLVEQDEIVVGTPMANRTDRQLEQAVGCFVNVVPLRLRLAGEDDPTALERIRSVAVRAFSNSLAPVERLVDDHRGRSPTGIAPLFQLLFALQNTPPSDLSSSLISIERYRDHMRTPLLPTLRFYSPLPELLDLSFSMQFTDCGISGLLEYRTDRIKRTEVETFLNRFATILAADAASLGARSPGSSDIP